jgi:hypothetical protein
MQGRRRTGGDRKRLRRVSKTLRSSGGHHPLKQEPDSRRAATADAREGIPRLQAAEDVNFVVRKVCCGSLLL